MGYWAWDPATDRLSIPPETARILGRDAAAPGSMQLDEYMTRYVHPDDLEWVRNETYLPQEPGRRYQAEYRVVTET
jgi:hypothetical protein